MRLQRVEQPELEPVTLEETKLFCRITQDEEDTYISQLITSARRMVEYGNLCLNPQTWRLYLDMFPVQGYIVLNRFPVSEIVEVKYIDSNGDEQTFAEENYYLDNSGVKPEWRLNYGTTYPSSRGDHCSVWIDFIAGFPNIVIEEEEEISGVPSDLKQCVLNLVLHQYENRLPVDNVQSYVLPLGLQTVLSNYDRGSF